MTDPLAVTQADRDAAADYWRDFVAKPGECIAENQMRAGHLDFMPSVQAFARHRIEATRLTPPVAEEGLVSALCCMVRFLDRAAGEGICFVGPDELAADDLCMHLAGELGTEWHTARHIEDALRAALSSPRVNIEGEVIEPPCSACNGQLSEKPCSSCNPSFAEMRSKEREEMACLCEMEALKLLPDLFADHSRVELEKIALLVGKVSSLFNAASLIRSLAPHVIEGGQDAEG
jgi:hypothetical protein